LNFVGFYASIFFAKQVKLLFFLLVAMFFLCEFQFPDDLLKDSTRVVAVLRKRLQSLRESDITGSGEETDIGLFVMADTAYGSCCVDEVGASHINADCVIHYGHTCFSP
jgi:diphthamide biosynthesis protein 2